MPSLSCPFCLDLLWCCRTSVDGNAALPQVDGSILTMPGRMAITRAELVVDLAETKRLVACNAGRPGRYQCFASFASTMTNVCRSTISRCQQGPSCSLISCEKRCEAQEIRCKFHPGTEKCLHGSGSVSFPE